MSIYHPSTSYSSDQGGPGLHRAQSGVSDLNQYDMSTWHNTILPTLEGLRVNSFESDFRVLTALTRAVPVSIEPSLVSPIFIDMT